MQKRGWAKHGKKSQSAVGVKTRLVLLLSNLGDPPVQSELAIMPIGEGGGRVKGIVEPGEQIPINEELLAKQRAQIGQRPPEGGAELKIFQQQHGYECCPNLRLQ